MSAFTLIALLSLLPSVIQALRCHQIASANLSNPPETQATDCIAGSLACTKLVDYTMKTFSKQCQQFNCTSRERRCHDNRENTPVNVDKQKGVKRSAWGFLTSTANYHFAEGATVEHSRESERSSVDSESIKGSDSVLAN
ncbi:unnamed protein product [Heligmosomoides polygyrus]|uniref:GDNF domain-containing protein n=1 Tax=Heligmosomoides polygyrus TaxID=6339 RepID=A0A183GS77_HELPZ|nr:unnamed protein product [Heligmosomoides polygyrus]